AYALWANSRAETIAVETRAPPTEPRQTEGRSAVWHGPCDVLCEQHEALAIGNAVQCRRDGEHRMALDHISRRRLMTGAAALGATTAVATSVPVRRAFAADTVIGFVYVGPHDDFGYNQSHAQGAAAVKKMAGVKVLEEENVPEDVAVAKTMESMIKE